MCRCPPNAIPPIDFQKAEAEKPSDNDDTNQFPLNLQSFDGEAVEESSVELEDEDETENEIDEEKDEAQESLEGKF